MAWHGWESLGRPPNGPFKGAPAVSSWGRNQLDVFVRGADGQLWHKYYDGRWSRWEGLDAGLALASSPAAAAWGPGRLDVFARGADGNLWHNYLV